MWSKCQTNWLKSFWAMRATNIIQKKFPTLICYFYFIPLRQMATVSAIFNCFIRNLNRIEYFIENVFFFEFIQMDILNVIILQFEKKNSHFSAHFRHNERKIIWCMFNFYGTGRDCVRSPYNHSSDFSAYCRKLGKYFTKKCYYIQPDGRMVWADPKIRINQAQNDADLDVDEDIKMWIKTRQPLNWCNSGQPRSAVTVFSSKWVFVENFVNKANSNF